MTTEEPHVITAACPLDCLEPELSTAQFRALKRDLATQFGRHLTVGHVMHVCRLRLLGSTRGLGIQGVKRVEQALTSAGLPTDAYRASELVAITHQVPGA